MNDSVTPREVFEAIEYAKTLNPNDKLGTGAFKIEYETPKPGNNNVNYYKVMILKKRGDKWDYIPFKLRFLKLSTKSRILKPDDEKRQYPGVKIQLAHDAVYVTKKDGKEVEQPYSAAKIMAVTIWRHLLKEAMKSGKIVNDNPKISGPVQTEFIKDKTKKIKEKLDAPIIRLEIPFRNIKEEEVVDEEDKKKKKNVKQTKKDNELKPTAKPLCDIYDQDKPIPETDSRYKKDSFNYENLAVERNGVMEDLTYETIGDVLVPGSIISGVDNMSNMSVSNMGYSLASKATFLIVKAGSRSRINPAKIFDAEELEALNSDLMAKVTVNEGKKEVVMETKKTAESDEEMFDNLDD
jgi:hypothetical protein